MAQYLAAAKEIKLEVEDRRQGEPGYQGAPTKVYLPQTPDEANNWNIKKLQFPPYATENSTQSTQSDYRRRSGTIPSQRGTVAIQEREEIEESNFRESLYGVESE